MERQTAIRQVELEVSALPSAKDEAEDTDETTCTLELIELNHEESPSIEVEGKITVSF